MGKFLNITGQKFGRLMAIRFDHKEEKIKGRRKYFWLFKCDCGKEIIHQSALVKIGNTRSCGCLWEENSKNLILKSTIHGMRKTRFWNIWRAMKHRCLNKDSVYYKYYGARGIKICDRWLKFENFRKDMYQSYLEHVEKLGERNTQIDRINNNGNYEPENCKWSTCREQCNNRRNNHFLTFQGQTLTIAQWARKLNINVKTLKSRILIYKWSTEKSLTTPIKH